MENTVIENMSFEQLLGGIREVGYSQGSYGRLYNAIMELDEDEFEELWELFGPKSAEYVASVNRSERQAYWQQLAMMAFDTKIRQTAEHAVELYGRRK